MYTITEFRDNLRQAFEDANQGHEVVIDRYSQKFQLVSLVKDPLPGHSFLSSPGKKPKPKPVGNPKTGLESLKNDPEQVTPLFRNKKKGKL